MRTLIAAAAAAVFVFGCGGDSDGSRSSDSQPTQAAAQDELAKSYLLTVNDFPAGWAENPSDDDSDTPEAIEKCTDDDRFSRGRVGYAESGDFERGNSGSVSHAVAIYETADQMSGVTDTVNRRAECIVKAFNDGKVDDGDVEFSDAKFAPVSFPKIGDATHAVRLSVHVKAKKQSGLGSEADVYIDMVYVFRGNIGFSLVAEDVLSPFDSQMLAQLAEKANAKIK